MAGIGKNEKLWLTAYDEHKNLRYLVTSNQDRSWYYIYDKDYKKLGKGKNPPELEKKYFNV